MTMVTAVSDVYEVIKARDDRSRCFPACDLLEKKDDVVIVATRQWKVKNVLLPDFLNAG